jgi:WD40 repeat protein
MSCVQPVFFEPEPTVLLRVNDRKKSSIERIVPVPELNAIICCEQCFGATLWDASGSMAIRARLLHGHTISTVADRMRIKREVAINVEDLDPGKMEAEMLQRGEYQTSVTVTDAAYASQVSRFLTAGMDGKICMWGARSPHSLLCSAATDCAQLTLACEHLQPIIYSAGTDGNLFLWRLSASGQMDAPAEVVATPHKGSWVTRLLRLAERPLLFSASEDCRVVEWMIKLSHDNTLSLERRRELSHHRLAIHALAFCGPADTMVSAGMQHVLFCWHVEAPDWLAPTRLEGHTRAVSEILASQQTGHAFSSDVGGTIRTWDLSAGECIQAIEPMWNVVGLQRTVALWPGKLDRLITVGGYREWHLYHQRKRERLHAAPVSAAICVPRLDLLLVAQDASVRLVHARSGTISGSVVATSGAQVTRLCLDPEERCLVLGFSDGAVAAWQIDENIDGQAGVALRGRGPPERLVPFATWLQLTPHDAVAHLITRADTERAGYFCLYAASVQGPAIHALDACSRATRHRSPPRTIHPLGHSQRGGSLICIGIAERQQLLFVGLQLPPPPRAVSLLVAGVAEPECELQLWHLNGSQLSSRQRFPFSLHAGCVVSELSLLACCETDGAVSLLLMPQLKWLARLRPSDASQSPALPIFDRATKRLLIAREAGGVQVWSLPPLLAVVEQRKQAATRRAAAKSLRRAQSFVNGLPPPGEAGRQERRVGVREPQMSLMVDAECAAHPGDARPYDGHSSTSFLTALAETAERQPELVAAQHLWFPFDAVGVSIEHLGDDSLLASTADGASAVFTTAGGLRGRLGQPEQGEATWQAPPCLPKERAMRLPLWLEDAAGPTWEEALVAAQVEDAADKARLAALRERQDSRQRSRLLGGGAAGRASTGAAPASAKVSSMTHSLSLPTLRSRAASGVLQAPPSRAARLKPGAGAGAQAQRPELVRAQLRLEALLNSEVEQTIRSIPKELIPMACEPRKEGIPGVGHEREAK